MTLYQFYISFVVVVYLALALGVGIFMLVKFFNLCDDVWKLKNRLLN